MPQQFAQSQSGPEQSSQQTDQPEALKQTSDQGDALDAVLDDIASTLESNAEQYVSSFVQKGGE